jgi:phosphoribosylamine--glycine ligase
MPQVGPSLVDEIMAVAVSPLTDALQRRGIDYRGVLYAGLMLGPDGPKVIEYNVRFGDPETQVVVPLLSCDAAELFMAVATGTLAEFRTPTFSDAASVCVVMAAPGYPYRPRFGDPIEGLDESGQAAHQVDGVTVLHAGTSRPDRRGPFLTSGGRVLGVRAVAPTLELARERAYAVAGTIEWDGMQLRSDIGADAASKEYVR